MQIGELFVRLSASSAPLNKAVREAQGSLGKFDAQVGKSSRSMGLLGKSLAGLGATLVASFSFAAVTAGLREAFREADNFDAAVRKLSATAKITGQNLGFLQKTANDTKNSFGIATATAADFTTEVVKLTSKAGQIEQTGEAIRAFLDLGAARGLDATQTLQAVRQAILGIDEGTDKLFGKNPSVIYKEFAEQIGIAAGKMNDQQKAMALLNAAMQDGGKVAGEFAKWLQTPAGEAYKLQVRMDEMQAGIGRSMSSFRRTVLPAISELVGWLARTALEVAVFAAKVPLFFEQIKFQLTRLNNETGGLVEGIASHLDRANSTVDRLLSKLPGGATAVRVLRTVDVGDNLVRGVASTAGRSMDEATAALERMERQVAETIAQLRRDMALTLDITGPTNPIAAAIAAITAAAEEAAGAAEKLAGGFRSAKIEADRLASSKGMVALTKAAAARTANVTGGTPTAPGIIQTARMPSTGEGGGGILGQVGNAFSSQLRTLGLQFGPLAAAAATLRPVFEGLMETLGPVLSTLAEPLRTIGQLLGTVIAPVLKLLAPPLNLLAKGVSYVVEAFGWLIEALGRFVDKIVPDWISKAGKGLAKMGQELQQGARDARRDLGSLKDGVDDFGDAVGKASAALVNYANVQHINALRFGIAGGMGSGSGVAGRPGGRPAVNVIVSGLPAEVIVEEGGKVIRRRASRGGTTRFALAT